MTKRDELLALAERCEKASGPYRILDLDIFRAIGAPLPSEFMSRKVGLEWDEVDLCFVMPIDTMRVRYEPPVYTASLDAAMTLVPANHDWSLFFDNGAALAGCMPASDDGCDWTDVPGATPALALCAAALRAAAEMES